MATESELKENNFESLWELYGLRTNPFSTSPLLVYGGLLPIDSFHGRESELKRLTKILSSSGGSRVLVCGDVGVGKTSLVNYARYKAIQKGFFTPFKEIKVQNDWDASSLIINTLYAIYSTMNLQKDVLLTKETFDKLKNLVEITALESKVTGLSFAGFGGEIAESRRVSQSPSSLALADFFQTVIREIYEKTNKDIIIHYNNLELLSEKSLRKLFEDLRDVFQTDNVHFIFVGNLSVHSTFQSMPRVSSIISDTPIILSDFSLREIEQIIRIRIEKLRIGKELNYIMPFSPEALKTLYDLYGGNIRNILNSLSTAIIGVANERPVILNEKNLSLILSDVVEKRYLVGLQPRAKDLLLEAVKHNEITNKNLSLNTRIARSNVSTYVKELEKHGCLYLRRKNGKDKFWSVEPKIKWLLLKPKNYEAVKSNDQAQKRLT